MKNYQREQVTETKTAVNQPISFEKEQFVQRRKAVSPPTSFNGDPHSLHQQTNGNLAHAGNVLLQLQNQYGNRYVQQIINPQQRLTVQPKLMLGDIDTPSEREADQIASQAVGSGQVTSTPTPVNGDTMPVSLETERAINQAKGSGQPLPEGTQTQMSQALGVDLSGVRIHTDSRADGLNQSLQAKAFTTGQDIFFRQGAYSDSSSAGQQLLAHELTHVQQQINASSSTIIQRNPNDNEKAEKYDKPEMGLIMLGGMLRAGIDSFFSVVHGATMVVAPNLVSIAGFIRNVLGVIKGICETVRGGMMLAFRNAKEKIKSGAEKAIRALSRIEDGLSTAIRALNVVSVSNIAYALSFGFRFAANAVEELESQGTISKSPNLKKGLIFMSESAEIVGDATSEGLIPALLDVIKNYGSKILIGLKRIAEPNPPQSASQQPEADEQSDEDQSWLEDTLDEKEKYEEEAWINSLLDEIPEEDDLNSFDNVPNEQPARQNNWQAAQEAKSAENDLFNLADSLTIEDVSSSNLEPFYSFSLAEHEPTNIVNLPSMDEVKSSNDQAPITSPGLVEPNQILVPPPRNEPRRPTQEVPQQEEIKVPSPQNMNVSASVPSSQNESEKAKSGSLQERFISNSTKLYHEPKRGGKSVIALKKNDSVRLTGKVANNNNEIWAQVQYYQKKVKYSKVSGWLVGWVPQKLLRYTKRINI